MAPRAALLAVMLAAAASLAAPASAETRALLLGVSRYASPAIPDLAGPANDLTAMEALVRNMGATDVISLRDAAVSRSSVEGSLQLLGSRAQAGDWIILYYTGHGAQARARSTGAQDGSFDQFVPLAGFDPDHQDPERFIVDKDFYAWLSRYVPGDVRVLMVVDSCHSGTMHRAIDPRAFSFTSRLAFRAGDERSFELVARPGPRLPPLGLRGRPVDPETREDLPNLVYIGASRDDQLALETELPQEGSPSRGVLTYAFEQGLSTTGGLEIGRAADLDDDGQVTVLEMGAYLSGQVRMLSAQRQESTAAFPSAWSDLPLFSALPSPRPPADEPRPAVAFMGGPAEPVAAADAQSWRLADSRADADFIWDVAKHEVVRRSGDLVASEIVSPSAFLGVIEKWKTVMALQPLVSEFHARLVVDPGGSDLVYGPGTPVTLTLASTRRSRRYATVFNLAADGTVQFLYPLAGDGDGMLPDTGGVTLLETTVVAPFGADHIIAVMTPDPATDLRAVLRSADGERAAGRLTSQIRAKLKRARSGSSIAIAELYTGQ